MAARPDILLQGRVPDVGATFRNALLNVQGIEGIRQARAQAERDAQLQPLRDRLLQAQTTTAEQGVQTPQQLGSARNQARLESIANFSQFALPGLQDGDIEGTRSALQQRRQSLVQAAAQGQEVDTREVDEALQLLDTNPQLLAQRMQQAIQAQQQVTARGRAPTTFQKGATFQVDTPEGPAIATNIIDPTTGAQRLEITPLGAGVTPVSRLGESAAEQTLRKVQQAQQIAKAQAGVEIETAPTIAGGKKAAEAAISQSEKAFERLAKVSTNITNFDDAIRSIDEGAETGPIVSKLPSFRKSTIELINVGNRLGLDVVGSTTFGALSESELAFAKSTALPVNLEPQDLKRWLQRKKDVQIKLADELTKAAQFLGTPGNTIADFLSLRELDKIDQESPSATPSGTQQTQIGRFTVEVE